MISICVTVKNRSRVLADQRELLLFPNCVRSIVASASERSDCELVIADWNSDDWPLNEWIPRASAPVPTRIINVDGAFCRGRGRNIAGQHARGDALLFLDADCLLSHDVIAAGLYHIEQGASFFPVLFSFDSPDHTTGWWRHEGFGNCMVLKDTLESVGGWPELPAWGKEDDDFYARVANHTPVARQEVAGFYHQWHPESISWKDRYRDDTEIQQLRSTLSELWDAIPTGRTFIFVDEAQFGGHEQGCGRSVLPFTENEGVYWGPPADAQAAITELERQRSRGASHIAFVSNTFWWLDYYSQFRSYLDANYSRQLESPRVILFDLQK